MSKSTTRSCSECERLREQVRRLEEKVASLEAEWAKARKHSGNSSKPPSGDIVKPPRTKPGSGQGEKRKRGGQPGHERHERLPFSADEIDDFPEYRDSECPCCGGLLHDVELASQTLQQVDIEEILIRVREHRSVAQQCSECHKLHFASFPPELVQAGLVGPRLTALVGFLKGACHMSYSAIRKFFRDVVGFRISRGQLRKLIGKVTHSLQDPRNRLYGEQLLEHFRKLFHIIHRREAYSSEQTFRRALNRVRKAWSGMPRWRVR